MIHKLLLVEYHFFIIFFYMHKIENMSNYLRKLNVISLKQITYLLS